MHYPGHFNFCTNLFSMFTMKWESQNIFGMCIFIIYVTVFTLLFKICTLLILLQLNICNWWGVGCFYHPTFQNIHRPTALHFMKEDLIFHLKKGETSKIICVPFQAATILSSRCGLGRFCLSLYKRVLHFSTISLTSVGFKENFTAVSSKDSLTNNTFWFFNSSWGSCKYEKQIPGKYNVKSWSTNTSIYSLW